MLGGRIWTEINVLISDLTCMFGYCWAKHYAPQRYIGIRLKYSNSHINTLNDKFNVWCSIYLVYNLKWTIIIYCSHFTTECESEDDELVSPWLMGRGWGTWETTIIFHGGREGVCWPLQGRTESIVCLSQFQINRLASLMLQTYYGHLGLGFIWNDGFTVTLQNGWPRLVRPGRQQ